MDPIEPNTLDGLWERIRGGDRRAARELVDHLIIEGDEEQVQAASRAIGRHFEREARDLLRRAHMVEGEPRRTLTAETLEALTTAAVATRLPELIRASLAAPGTSAADLPVPALPPATGLVATGVNSGIDLRWTPSFTDLAVLGQEVIVQQDLEIVHRSAVLDPAVARYTAGGLTNGESYLLVVKTLAAGTSSTANVTGTAGQVQAEALPAAAGLTATPANRSLGFAWNDPTTTGATITSYRLVLTGDNLEREATVPLTAAAAPHEHTFTELQNDTPYTLALQTIGTVGGVPNQLGGIASLSAIPGVSGTPFVPQVPALTADPLLFLEQSILGEIASAEELRVEALSIAQKWRYEYLKQKAVDAAQEALAYDRQIVDLMSMALQKGLGAETQLTPVILKAMTILEDDTQTIADVAKVEAVEDAIDSLGDAVTSSVMLTAILQWMARRDALDVWIGLFEALIDDASDYDKSLTHTKDFIDEQYESTVFGKAVKEIAKLQLARIGPTVDAAVRPLRAAVRELIGATSEKMGAVFAAFDLPILMSDGGKVDVPNVNPLIPGLENIANAVDTLERQLTKKIREKLQRVADGNNKALFRSFMIAYFVTPILAALAVSVAGGPVAAAVIAGVVAVGAQALLHKVARWVLGPLQDPVEDLEKRVARAFRALQKAIADEAPLTLASPEDELQLLENELRLIRTLLPRAFLEELAALLAEARALTLSSGLLHALSAERALGYDHATAFDRILPSYASSFTPASLLPGGSDTGLFCGAALLRDLERLDQDLIRMSDGRDVEITRRLSLFQLLGGVGDPMTATGMALGRFADFLRTGQTAVEIRPETLLDPVSPGMYRPIVESVSVIGLARAPVVNTLATASGLSVTVTHSGRSSMRVRRDANPSAPPITLPAGLVDETSYVLATTYKGGTTAPFAARSLEAAVASIISSIPEGELSWKTIRAACRRKLPKAVGGLANLVALRPVSASASSANPRHPPANAIDGDRATYWASTPPAKFPAKQVLEVGLGATYPVVGARLWPRPGFAGWPNNWSLDVVDGGTVRRVQSREEKRIDVPGREAIYVQFAPLSGASVRFEATLLSAQPICEVAEIQIVARHMNPPFLSSAPLERAVAAVLRRMPWPTEDSVSDTAAAAVLIAAALRAGVPAEALRGLADPGTDPTAPGASRTAYQNGRTELLSHVAKWAGAQWTEDPDPNVHGIGFVRLEQTIAPGAATFDLFPSDEAAAGPSVVLRPREPRTGGDNVYTPLQNLGLGGVLQVEAPGAAAALIADIILEIRMRACYDRELAATVRANQQQRSQQIDRMVDIGAKHSRVLQLGTPTVKASLTEPHTAQFSLRTNRDRILQAAVAGAQVQAGTVDLTGEQIVDGLTFIPGTPEVAPLGAGAPFSYFGTPNPTEIALVFTRNPSATLGAQTGKIVITPATLGVDVALLDGLTPDDDPPMLTGLTVAMIATYRRPTKRDYPIAGTVSPLLRQLLPAVWTAEPKKPLPRLSMLSRPKPVSLASLFPLSGGEMVVTVDVGPMIAEKDLYDIIFAVTCNVPLLTAQTTSANFL